MAPLAFDGEGTPRETLTPPGQHGPGESEEATMDGRANGRSTVDFYLDTACPWSWRTSVWMREVVKTRPVDVHWKFFSLEEVNKSAGPPRDSHMASRRTFRTMVLARRRQGDAAVDRLY
jgi:Mycothiol-dependent nitroreductase Rv2466c